jgi:hypothetical protein
VDCAAGSHQPRMGTTACSLCPTGKSQAQLGLTSCDNCNPGRWNSKFRGDSRRRSCFPCAFARFLNWKLHRSALFPRSLLPHAYYNRARSASCSHASSYAHALSLSLSLSLSFLSTSPPPLPGAWAAALLGKYTDAKGSIGCTPCATGFASPEGQAACRLADVSYYRLAAYADADAVRVAECPAAATCAGGLTAPAPKRGYWSDRSRCEGGARTYMSTSQ